MLLQIFKNIGLYIALAVLKTVNKILTLIKSELDQRALTSEINDNILYLKISDIQNKLLKCNKTFLVSMILSLRLKDENDVNECYEKLILHNEQLLNG